MASSSAKIHLFKKSTIEFGTPELYYLNPSDNLWKITSMWRAVEHEDFIDLTLDLKEMGDLVLTKVDGKFINIEVEKENKERGAARFDHKDGMKKFSIEMNPHFLHIGIEGDDYKSWDMSRKRISKLTPIEIKRYAERKNDPKPKAEEKSKGPYTTVTINVSRLN